MRSLCAPRTTGRLALAFAFASALASLGPATQAEAEIIERVVAVVNEDAIFLSQLRQKAAPFIARAFSQAPTETARQQAVREIYTTLLERMIDERLVLQVADAEDITVSTTEVSQAIENVRRQSGLGLEEFWQAVRAQGFTEAQYRRDVRQQLLRLKVLNQRVRARVNITEDDVRRRYDQLAVQARRTARFRVAHILVPLAPGASAVEVTAARRQAEAIRTEIEDPDSFEDAMEEHGGSELGLISQGDLEETLEATLLPMEEGEISQAVRGSSGYFIFLLRERVQASEGLEAYEDMRMDIYREMVEEAMGRQEQLFLEELRRRAVIERRLEI